MPELLDKNGNAIVAGALVRCDDRAQPGRVNFAGEATCWVEGRFYHRDSHTLRVEDVEVVGVDAGIPLPASSVDSGERGAGGQEGDHLPSHDVGNPGAASADHTREAPAP